MRSAFNRAFRQLPRLAQLGVAAVMAMAVLLGSAMLNPARAFPDSPAGVKPDVPECTVVVWRAFNSNENHTTDYDVWALTDGLYDNYDGAFCGQIRGHLQVLIPAFHVGGNAQVSLNGGPYTTGTASNAGSSGYWYNLTTPVNTSTSCGYTIGSFTPSGGSALGVATNNSCA